MDQNMHQRNREITSSIKSGRARPVHKYVYDFPEECAEIYRRLFAYDSKISFGRMSTKDRYYTIKVVIELSRFIEKKSLFDINIKVHTKSGLESPCRITTTVPPPTIPVINVIWHRLNVLI